MAKYYFIKYRDQVLNANHKGFCTDEAMDRIFAEMAPDGFTRNAITALVGDLPLNFVKEQRKKHRLGLYS